MFNHLLNPAKVEPDQGRQVELTAVILLLVASSRGITVLPDWVLRSAKNSTDYVTKPLTKDGIRLHLYAAVRSDEAGQEFMSDFITQAQRETR